MVLTKQLRIMKKVFYSLCAIVACTCVWVACSDDESFEKSRESTNRERLEKIIQKYDVDFVLNDSILSTDLSDAELAEVEEVLKCLSGVRGTYKLHADSCDDGTYSGTQLKKYKRNRRLTNSNEVVTYGSYSYGEEWIPAPGYLNYYLCNCTVQWKKVNNVREWVTVTPTIKYDNYYPYYDFFDVQLWGNDYDTFITSDSTFRFEGIVRGNVIYNAYYYPLGYVRYTYNGNFTNTCGTIIWDSY